MPTSSETVRGVASPAYGSLHERLHRAVGSRTFKSIGAATGTNHETVRRYMNGQAPSADFLAAVCNEYGVSGQWLLTGDGPERASDLKAHALEQANTPELFNAMANTLDTLAQRIERLEVFVQTLEAGLRGRKASPACNGDTDGRAESDAGRANGQCEPGSAPRRARRIASSFAKRPSEAPDRADEADRA